jgi:hypothetical protein
MVVHRCEHNRVTWIWLVILNAPFASTSRSNSKKCKYLTSLYGQYMTLCWLSPIAAMSSILKNVSFIHKTTVSFESSYALTFWVYWGAQEGFLVSNVILEKKGSSFIQVHFHQISSPLCNPIAGINSCLKRLFNKIYSPISILSSIFLQNLFCISHIYIFILFYLLVIQITNPKQNQITPGIYK